MLVLLIIITVFLTGCDTSDVIDNITIEELVDVLDEDYQFVDVRTEDEYIDYHIEEFDINIDYYELIEKQVLLNILDKDKTVVLICRSGNRSLKAAGILKDAGFSSIYNVMGGINEWNK
ncbi:rhodanese-like domain-containing protein [Mycoplasmatota bacterium WC44]